MSLDLMDGWLFTPYYPVSSCWDVSEKYDGSYSNSYVSWDH